MTKNKCILSGFLLLVMIIFLSCGQSIAVVPYPLSTEEKPEARTKEDRLLEIVEKIETHEKADIEFCHNIEKELKQILNKEGIGNER